MSDNFSDLLRAANYAVLQATKGKGQERHGNGKHFLSQPIFEISRMIDSPGGLAFQAIKKLQEASRMSPEAAIHEYRGAVIYILALMLFTEEQSGEQMIPDIGSEENLNQFMGSFEVLEG